MFRLLGLDSALLPAALAAADDFPLKVPRSYVARMRQADPADPLLLQVLGQGKELDAVLGFNADPLEEKRFTPVPGILHKYHGRVLFMVTGACAIHCRYCFRRHFPYQEHVPTAERLQEALGWLRAQTDISEVILSGGDPLSLSDRRLRELFEQLSALPNVKRLRIHSRLPVVMPARVSTAFLEMCAQLRKPLAMVVHANHAAELSDEVADALSALRGSGVTILNQTVLLAGVNANLHDQVTLSERLYEVGVLPYYLHQLDAVAGAAHFAVSDQQALALHEQMKRNLPGYLVPRLVREQPDENSKTWLG
jgi:EF-P beta-lysylation protein EpmB